MLNLCKIFYFFFSEHRVYRRITAYGKRGIQSVVGEVGCWRQFLIHGMPRTTARWDWLGNSSVKPLEIRSAAACTSSPIASVNDDHDVSGSGRTGWSRLRCHKTSAVLAQKPVIYLRTSSPARTIPPTDVSPRSFLPVYLASFVHSWPASYSLLQEVETSQ